MTKTIPFTHKGEAYEVRWAFDGQAFQVRAFKDGHPANGFNYSVRLPVAYDLKTALDEDIIARFIEEAKQDVLEGRWETFLKAVERVKADEKRQQGARA